MTEDREDRARYEVLFEQNETHFKVLAEKLGAMMDKQCETNTRLERVETKVDRLEIRVDVLEKFASDAQQRLTRVEASATDTQQRLTRVEQRLTRVEASGIDTRKRLGRIETHLQLNGSHPRKTTRAAPIRRSKKR